MKPPIFDYVAPTSIDMAVAALAEAGGDAKILAGGQSLVPMLNFRLLHPSILVDINRIAGLAFIEETADSVRIGALTRHFQLETSPLIARCFPVVSCAMTHVAHLAIRNRGTIGGSLAACRMPIRRPSFRCWRCCSMPNCTSLRRLGSARPRHATFSSML
jgi:CO/xanthine dehydrogenase FAD-binding subunit